MKAYLCQSLWDRWSDENPKGIPRIDAGPLMHDEKLYHLEKQIGDSMVGEWLHNPEYDRNENGVVRGIKSIFYFQTSFDAITFKMEIL